jgi:hypothetical protein
MRAQAMAALSSMRTQVGQALSACGAPGRRWAFSAAAAF